MRMKIALTAALAAVLSLAASQSAQATTILTFGQTGANAVTAVNNGAGTTTLTATNVAVIITQIELGGTVSIPALLNLNAVSSGPAVQTGGPIFFFDSQPFGGSFSITGGGNNYLSGTFVGGTVGFGLDTGVVFTLLSSQPPGAVNFTTDRPDLINPAFLPGLGFSLSFADVTPGLGISGAPPSLSSFKASVSGVYSDNVGRGDIPVPEPASMLLLGTGLVGLGARLRRRK